MSDSLRSLIADTLAAHRDELSRVLGDTLRPYPVVLKCSCGEWSMPFDHLGITEVAADHRAHVADAILSALDGQLLPEGGQTREEWAVRGNEAKPWLTEHKSEGSADEHLTWMARVYPDMRPFAEKVARTVYTGSWRPVESEET